MFENFFTKIWYGKTLSCRTSLKSGTVAAVPAVPAPSGGAAHENWNCNLLASFISPSQLDYPAASTAVKPITAAWIVRWNARKSSFYSPLCHSNRVESAIVLGRDEFRLIKSAKRAVCGTLSLIGLFFVYKHMDLNSNALKTWSQWTFAIAVNIGNDSN